jgi:hypothetical protein
MNALGKTSNVKVNLVALDGFAPSVAQRNRPTTQGTTQVWWGGTPPGRANPATHAWRASMRSRPSLARLRGIKTAATMAEVFRHCTN